MIIFEGLDGTGKTTAHRAVHEFLTDNVYLDTNRKAKLHVGREPSKPIPREDISELDKMHYYNYHRWQRIKYCLLSNQDKPVFDIVLMDRWALSSVVYQGEKTLLCSIQSFLSHPTEYNKFTLIFAADFETCRKRKPEDYQEGNDNCLKFHDRDATYRDTANKMNDRPLNVGNAVIIDTNNIDEQQTAIEACNIVSRFLEAQGFRFKKTVAKYFQLDRK